MLHDVLSVSNSFPQHDDAGRQLPKRTNQWLSCHSICGTWLSESLEKVSEQNTSRVFLFWIKQTNCRNARLLTERSVLRHAKIGISFRPPLFSIKLISLLHNEAPRGERDSTAQSSFGGHNYKDNADVNPPGRPLSGSTRAMLSDVGSISVSIEALLESDLKPWLCHTPQSCWGRKKTDSWLDVIT